MDRVWFGILAFAAVCAAPSAGTAQGAVIGYEHNKVDENDVDGAQGFMFAFTPARRFEVRLSRSDRIHTGIGRTCSDMDQDCSTEDVTAEGRHQSYFLGWRVGVFSRGSVRLGITPEVGITRIESDRFGLDSQRVLRLRSDMVGAGVRASLDIGVPKTRYLFIRLESGARALTNVAPRGEIESYEHASGQKVIHGSIGIGYGR